MAIAKTDKTPLALWVVALRKRLYGDDVAAVEAFAKAVGANPNTVRGWEARGRPGADKIRRMEELAGEPAPTSATQPGIPELIPMLAAQIETINRLILEIQGLAPGAVRLGVEQSSAAQGAPRGPRRARGASHEQSS